MIESMIKQFGPFNQTKHFSRKLKYLLYAGVDALEKANRPEPAECYVAYLDERVVPKVIALSCGNSRQKDKNLDALYKKLKPQDLIYVALKHCMSDACTEHDLFRLVLFVQDKYKELPIDFDGHLLVVDPVKLTRFYSAYARLMSDKNNNLVGWHHNSLTHAV